MLFAFIIFCFQNCGIANGVEANVHGKLVEMLHTDDMSYKLV